MERYLFIINNGPYGDERPYNALRLAMSLVKREATQVKVFLTADGVACARKNQKTPDGYYNIERMIKALAQRGATIQAYDPVAMTEAARVLHGTPGLSFVDHQSAALRGADALLIVTEWKEFRTPDFEAIKATLKQPLILDGRNLYDPALMQAFGIDYVGIGRGARQPDASA